MVIKTLAAVTLCAVVASASLVVPPQRATVGKMFPFPLYKQCDPRWGTNQMGTVGNGERSTICGEGCAMTSTTMALAGLGVKGPDGNPLNPGTFNAWLIANGGYLCAGGDCNNLNLTAPENYNFGLTLIGEAEKPSFQEIVRDIKAGSVIHVAHVRNNSHFVLLTWPASTVVEAFQVNDPYFPVQVYPYANITDIIRYKVNKYPVYKQCDPRWGNDVMGANNATICQVGCLMSSITMALAGTGILMNGSMPTPALVDRFLQLNGGFDSESDLRESVIPQIDPSRIKWEDSGMHLKNDIPFANVTQMLDRAVPPILIANVMHGRHFVLVTGYRGDGDSLVVNDPGFNTVTYSYSNDVVGWRVFEMK